MNIQFSHITGHSWCVLFFIKKLCKHTDLLQQNYFSHWSDDNYVKLLNTFQNNYVSPIQFTIWLNLTHERCTSSNAAYGSCAFCGKALIFLQLAVHLYFNNVVLYSTKKTCFLCIIKPNPSKIYQYSSVFYFPGNNEYFKCVKLSGMVLLLRVANNRYSLLQLFYSSTCCLYCI